MSVAFDFNASLNDVAPLSPILFPVYLMRIEQNYLLMVSICVLLLLSSHHRSSSVSVVFDFNASLNDVAPVSQILLPIDAIQHKNVNLFCSYQWFMVHCDFLHPKFIFLHETMPIKRQTIPIVNSPSIRPVINIKMNFLDCFFL